MMSHNTLPDWNLMHQRQQQVDGEEGNSNISSHVHIQLNPSCSPALMSNYEVAELTWENGQPAMHGHGGFPPPSPAKPTTWGRTTETLESIVHQATKTHKPDLKFIQQLDKNHPPSSSQHVQMDYGAANLVFKKRARSDSDCCGRPFRTKEDLGDQVGSPNFRRDSDKTMVTWGSSFESSQSLKTRTTYEDSGASENGDGEQETRGETRHPHPLKQRRAATIHNLSERRRRDKINQKIKALQKLVPNASKTDKASMLDEVIEYLKQLQAQVHMMSMRNMPQMMLPLGVQQQLQMSLLAHMALGMGGVGMLDMTRAAVAPPFPPLLRPTPVAAANPTYVPQPLLVPTFLPPSTATGRPSSEPSISLPLSHPYGPLLSQSVNNSEIYKKMAELHRQQT